MVDTSPIIKKYRECLMQQVRLVRQSADSKKGTIGALSIDGYVCCVTLEPYHRNNKRGVSSIPSGQYVCKRIKSPKFGETFQVTDVEGRSSILFHSGNTQKDTGGCILLGKACSSVGIVFSTRAMSQFMKLITGNSFKLTIIEQY